MGDEPMVAEPMPAFDAQVLGGDEAPAKPPKGLFAGAALSGAARRAARAAPWPSLPALAEADARGDDAARRRTLAAAIEGAIVPRLVLSHPRQAAASDAAAAAGPHPTAAEVEAFATLLLAEDEAGVAAFVRDVCARGTALDAIYLDLLGPAACRLGEMWEDDVADFASVTLGMRQLYTVLHALSPSFGPERPQRDARRRALISAVPGEQHTFGVAVVGEFLHRAGWDVLDAVGLSRAELAATVAREWLAVAVLSASAEARLADLGAAIHAVRKASLNAGIAVMVGGRVFVDHPEAVALVGADATAADARQAVTQAERLLAQSSADAAARPALL